MKEFQEKRFLRRIIFSRISFLILVLIFSFVAYSTVKVFLRSRQAIKINEMVKKEIEDLKTKKTDLEASVKRLGSETGVEEELRSKFSVQKPDEKMIVIIDEKKTDNLSENSSGGFFIKIWQSIKNIF